MRRFQVGDKVTFDPGVKHGFLASGGLYEVIAALPHEDHATEYLYRIKSTREATIRVVRESQLTLLSSDLSAEGEGQR